MARPNMKFLAAMIAAAALSVPMLAHAAEKPDLSRPEEYKKNDEVFDRQFRASRDNPQAAAAKSDPWGGVRSEPTQPATATAKKPKK